MNRPILIIEEMKKDGPVEAIGGISTIANLTYGLPHFSNLEEYVKVVKDKSVVRTLIRTCNQITSEALAEEDDAEVILDDGFHRVAAQTFGGREARELAGPQPVQASTVRAEPHRARAIFFMWITVLLGLTFLGFQAYEYGHAYSELNLKLSSGIYGSTFFMLTGFHGFHVTMGAIMLSVVLYRVLRGHFTPEHHFAFEGAAWYWHFVDVVWLGLYVVVYWL